MTSPHIEKMARAIRNDLERQHADGGPGATDALTTWVEAYVDPTAIAQAALSALAPDLEGLKEEVARIIHDDLGFNVLTDDLVAVRRVAAKIAALIASRPDPSAAGDGGWRAMTEAEFYRRETQAVRDEVQQLLADDPPAYVRPDRRAEGGLGAASGGAPPRMGSSSREPSRSDCAATPKSAAPIRLNPAERAVLDILGPDGGDHDWLAYPFRPIEAHTGLDRRTVRRACRSLSRKGLAAFERALMTEVGDFAGAGYRATKAGAAIAAALNPDQSADAVGDAAQVPQPIREEQ